MAFFRFYFKYSMEDIAALILQISYSTSVMNDFLNLRHKDRFKENIVVKPTPSLGVYHLNYSFYFEGMFINVSFYTLLINYLGALVFAFTLYTKYIFSYVDFVNVDLHNIYGKTPNELINIFNGMKRSSSRTSNRDNSSIYPIYTFIRMMWDSLETYFSLKNMAKEGFDIRRLDALTCGLKEFVYIVEKLQEIFGKKFIEIRTNRNLSRYTNLSTPSFAAFDCRMAILFSPVNQEDLAYSTPVKSMFISTIFESIILHFLNRKKKRKT